MLSSNHEYKTLLLRCARSCALVTTRTCNSNCVLCAAFRADPSLVAVDGTLLVDKIGRDVVGHCDVCVLTE